MSGHPPGAAESSGIWRGGQRQGQGQTRSRSSPCALHSLGHVSQSLCPSAVSCELELLAWDPTLPSWLPLLAFPLSFRPCLISHPLLLPPRTSCSLTLAVSVFLGIRLPVCPPWLCPLSALLSGSLPLSPAARSLHCCLPDAGTPAPASCPGMPALPQSSAAC